MKEIEREDKRIAADIISNVETDLSIGDSIKVFLTKVKDTYISLLNKIRESKHYYFIMTILLIVCITFIIIDINNYEDAQLCKMIRSSLGY